MARMESIVSRGIVFVYDGLALSGHDIETAFPAPGQILTALQQPVLRP
jgi:hypothetical protein